jgi:hypothetical protein
MPKYGRTPSTIRANPILLATITSQFDEFNELLVKGSDQQGALVVLQFPGSKVRLAKSGAISRKCRTFQV